MATKPNPAKTASAADKLNDFVKKEKLVLTHTYTLSVKKEYRNVIPESVKDAINLGMLTVDIQLAVAEAKS